MALAKLAEQAERWDGTFSHACCVLSLSPYSRLGHTIAQQRRKDVIKQLKSVISYSDARLTMEERNLLSIAYKHVTGTLRTSWRTVENVEKQEAASGSATPREIILIRRQREKIELELADACQDLLNLLDRYLVPAAEEGEERVFYHKMHVHPFHSILNKPVLPRARTGRATTTGTLQSSHAGSNASARHSSRSRRIRPRINMLLERSRRGTRHASESRSTSPSSSTTYAAAPTARATLPSMRSTRPSLPWMPRRSTRSGTRL